MTKNNQINENMDNRSYFTHYTEKRLAENPEGGYRKESQADYAGTRYSEDYPEDNFTSEYSSGQSNYSYDPANTSYYEGDSAGVDYYQDSSVTSGYYQDDPAAPSYYRDGSSDVDYYQDSSVTSGYYHDDPAAPGYYRDGSSEADFYQDQIPSSYPENFADQTQDQATRHAEETLHPRTGRQKRFMFAGLGVLALIVIIAAVISSAGPGRSSKTGAGDQALSKSQDQTFAGFYFQLPASWQELEVEHPTQGLSARSFAPKDGQQGEIFTVYTAEQSQLTSAAQEKLSADDILNSYLEATQQESKIQEFSLLKASYPWGEGNRTYSYKLSQTPDTAYVLNTVVLKEGKIIVFQTAAAESEQDWVESTHASIVQSLKLA